ncbi:hypothetical protein [Ruminococcus sp. HUN007]|uniref:hypothetical protein n=1 Tax=Ruminococcus sp. HUN007 TaxID=1514668 RepID=UPI0005D1C3A3|nr:hypothetical protein [Ruminococcus sp. HUN007]
MKVNGWDRTYYEMYECDAKYDIINKALSLRDSLNGISQFDIDNNSYMPDLSIGVTYVFEKHSGCYKLAVGSGAVMQVLSQTVFPNTIFYFIACKGASDHIFNKFLLDHGAAGVIGFDKTSRSAMSIPIAKKTFEHAFDELPGSNWKTLQDAHLEANIKANLNPVNAIETVFANVRCALDYSSTADYYAEKYFYYRGYGTISANICVHDEDDNLIVRDPDDTRYRVEFYRYSNNGLLHGYGGVFNGCNNGITDFSYTVDYGSYLIQFVDAYNDAETFIRTDLTDRRLDLGQIIIIEKTDLFKFVYNSYLNLYGKAPSDSEVNKWKQALKDKSINAASMVKTFYTDNLNAIVDMDNQSWALKAYNAFVGKAPDDTKRKELEIIALSGQSHENIAKYIIESDDFKNRCNELNILPGEW